MELPSNIGEMIGGFYALIALDATRQS